MVSDAYFLGIGGIYLGIIPEPSPVDRGIPCIDLRPGLPESFIVARMDKVQFLVIQGSL